MVSIALWLCNKLPEYQHFSTRSNSSDGLVLYAKHDLVKNQRNTPNSCFFWVWFTMIHLTSKLMKSWVIVHKNSSPNHRNPNGIPSHLGMVSDFGFPTSLPLTILRSRLWSQWSQWSQWRLRRLRRQWGSSRSGDGACGRRASERG